MELALTLGGDSCTGKPNKNKAAAGGLHFSMDVDEDADREAPGIFSAPALHLLPLAPPRRYSPNFLSSGSSENGSSPAAKGFDVNRSPSEESAPLLGGRKRDFEDDDDDDDNGPNSRKKLRLSKQQSAFLEESFKEHHTLNPKQKLALAKHLNLRPRQVEVWFQNRRARTKLKQTEVDCEYLKRCCETLSEENRRLHKELQDLRALKAGSPFYAQLPATTLTMCPACERVATAAAPPPRTNFFPLSTHPNQPAAS